MAFKPGDIVTLRSGGPAMTVVSVAEDEAKCVWIGEEGDFFRESVPTVALERIEIDDDLDDDEEDEDEAESIAKALTDEAIEDALSKSPLTRKN